MTSRSRRWPSTSKARTGREASAPVPNCVTGLLKGQAQLWPASPAPRGTPHRLRCAAVGGKRRRGPLSSCGGGWHRVWAVGSCGFHGLACGSQRGQWQLVPSGLSQIGYHSYVVACIRGTVRSVGRRSLSPRGRPSRRNRLPGRARWPAKCAPAFPRPSGVRRAAANCRPPAQQFPGRVTIALPDGLKDAGELAHVEEEWTASAPPPGHDQSRIRAGHAGHYSLRRRWPVR